MSSRPEVETAVELSSVDGGRLGQTLALVLSRREMPDTSRKPRERGTVLCQHKTLPAKCQHPGLTLAQPKTNLSQQ